MKTLIVVLFALSFHFGYAQFFTSTPDASGIYYSGGNVGIGINSPQTKLHVNGHLTLDAGTSHPAIFTGTGNVELNKFLTLNNSLGHSTASGLKAGGILVSDSYGYANPGKNDLIVKGNVGIGTADPLAKFHVNGHLLINNTSGNASIFTGTGSSETNKYLALITSPNFTSASGLKAGGILIADSYAYANPGKNDLIVKGNVGIGTVSPGYKLDVYGNLRTTDYIAASQYIAVNKDGSYLVAMNGQTDGYVTGRNAAYENKFLIASNGVSYFNGGNVGIGTTNPGSFKLAVNGKIWSQEVNVAMTNPGPDYVFEKDYNLLPLAELEAYVNQHKHLPEVPSAKEMETDGLNLKEMNLILLKKVEELTLHLIEQNKTIKEQNERILKLEKKH